MDPTASTINKINKKEIHKYEALILSYAVEKTAFPRTRWIEL